MLTPLVSHDIYLHLIVLFFVLNNYYSKWAYKFRNKIFLYLLSIAQCTCCTWQHIQSTDWCIQNSCFLCYNVHMVFSHWENELQPALMAQETLQTWITTKGIGDLYKLLLFKTHNLNVLCTLTDAAENMHACMHIHTNSQQINSSWLNLCHCLSLSLSYIYHVGSVANLELNTIVTAIFSGRCAMLE